MGLAASLNPPAVPIGGAGVTPYLEAWSSGSEATAETCAGDAARAKTPFGPGLGPRWQHHHQTRHGPSPARRDPGAGRLTCPSPCPTTPTPKNTHPTHTR